MYSFDDRENPGLFTATGILVALLLGTGVFFLLYSALAPPGSDALPVRPTTTPTITTPAGARIERLPNGTVVLYLVHGPR